jgi:multiple sugar transport system permease protein
MFLALLLSGFFTRRRWWIKALLPLFILPWALPSIPAFVSFHWMLIGEEGLMNSLLAALLGVQGPLWFHDRRLALGSNIVAYVWKWMPFWTLTFYAGRTAIPQEIYEAAAVDGAGACRRFVHVVVPLLGNLYLVCTLLGTLWTAGDFTTVSLVSEGAPAYSTDVLATLGIHYAFEAARPALGIATVTAALAALIPIALALMRAPRTRNVQL